MGVVKKVLSEETEFLLTSSNIRMVAAQHKVIGAHASLLFALW